MDAIIKYLKSIKSKLNAKYFTLNIIGKNNSVRNFIIELNTIDQLYDEGIDSKSISLGNYAPFTIREKISKGQPTDRVTLKDTGDFYKSFDVKVLGNGDVEIVADTIKYGFDGAMDLTDIYGDDILGLSADSLDKLVVRLIIELQKFMKTNVFKI